MRETRYKFEAIYKPTGEKFTPTYIEFTNQIVRGDFGGQTNNWCFFADSADSTYGDAWLRQYTGLKDKNGKEICELDVVVDKWGKQGIVMYHKSWGGFYFSRIDAWQSVPMWNDWNTVEVIGNIYENPELVGEKG